MRIDTHQEGVMKLSPAEFPTWHEMRFRPATPEHMHMTLTDEAQGCRGEFGHHYWGEHHPSFTTHLKGYVWLPGIRAYEVPRSMQNDIFTDKYGKVYMRVITDETLVPAWA
jgi:hypothetical protein